jgi:hypothetical protein
MRTIWFALTAIMSGPLSAIAQTAPQIPTAPSPVYVGGGVVSEGDNTWATATPATAGLTALAGLDVSRHVGVRLTVDVPRVVTTVSTPTTYRDATGTHSVTGEERHRSVSWSALVDVHGQASERVRVGFVTGVTAAHRPDQYDTVIDLLGPDGAVVAHNEYHSGGTFTWYGVTAGGEAVVSLTNHVALTADARVVGFPLAEYGRTSILRPGVSLRWRF